MGFLTTLYLGHSSVMIYIDTLPNDNVDEAVMATFAEKGTSRTLTRVYCRVRTKEAWHAITGWADGEPVDAILSDIEESGDGEACLIHGGNEGLRLCELTNVEDPDPEWDLDNPDQWGEGLIIVRPDAPVR